jgi:NUMOD3 motif-containing protein
MTRAVMSGPVHFIKNKYRRWYLLLMERARTRSGPVDGEWHHALPMVFGGTDSCMVRLTFREHFLAHWLLTKITTGEDRRSMNYAFAMMTKNPGYRLIAGWQFGRARQAYIEAARGRRVSAETRAKMSAAAQNRSAEYRSKQSAAHKGRSPSADTRAKLSAATRNIDPAKRAEMDAARRGFKHSAETRSKMSEAQTGRTVTLETRDKLRQRALGNKWNVGRKRSPDVGEKIRRALMGHSVSTETREKLRSVPRSKRSAAGKASWITRRANVDERNALLV